MESKRGSTILQPMKNGAAPPSGFESQPQNYHFPAGMHDQLKKLQTNISSAVASVKDLESRFKTLPIQDHVPTRLEAPKKSIYQTVDGIGSGSTNSEMQGVRSELTNRVGGGSDLQNLNLISSRQGL